MSRRFEDSTAKTMSNNTDDGKCIFCGGDRGGGCEGMPTLLLVAAMLMQPKRDGIERTQRDCERRADHAIADACALMSALENRLDSERLNDLGEG